MIYSVVKILKPSQSQAACLLFCSLFTCRWANTEVTFAEADFLEKYYWNTELWCSALKITVLQPCHYKHGPKVCSMVLTPAYILSGVLKKKSDLRLGLKEKSWAEKNYSLMSLSVVFIALSHLRLFHSVLLH